MHADAEIARRVARAGAEIVGSRFSDHHQASYKGDVNPVTDLDHAAEEAILAELDRLAPGEGVLSEEAGGAGWEAERVWIVDPLDGTVNLLHGVPHVAVSVGVWEKGQPVAGVVVDVASGVEYWAARGEGAWMGEQPLRVSQVAAMERGLLATGFPYDRHLHARAYTDLLAEMLTRIQGVRRFGSAALDLAWVAAGRFDAFWEFGLAPWDYAAGVLLVTEAGGVVTDEGGDPFRPGATALIASNGHLHEAVVSVVAAWLPAHLR